MDLLFSDAGQKRLDEIVQAGVLCVFDFDGTLSPIVSKPEHAGLPADVRERLVELQKRAPVAILTGRSLDDIRQRLGFEPDYVVGNHGLEGVPGQGELARDFEQVCRDWHRQLAAALQDRTLFEPGTILEDKKYSLSVHYRRVRNRRQARARLTELFASLVPPPRVIGGKCVFNLLPHEGVDKGWALQELVRLCSARTVIYVGDDVTDEDVFRLQRPDLVSVRIGHSNATAAQFYLAERNDILGLIDGLIARLGLRVAKSESALV